MIKKLTMIFVISMAIFLRIKICPCYANSNYGCSTTAGTDPIVADQQIAGYVTPFGATTLSDVNISVGVMNIIGPVGSWITNVTTVISKPVLSDASMDPNSVNVSSSPSQLTIELFDDNFSSLNNGFSTAIGGTTNGSVNSVSYYDTLNIVPSQLMLSNLGSFGPGAFSGSDSKLTSLTINPFSLRLLVILTSASPVEITSFDIEGNGIPAEPFPEPATMLLLGTGLVGVAGAARKKKKNQA